MSVHELKINRRWYDRIVAGEKSSEVRRHDRDYQAGDRLCLTVEPPRRATNGDPLADSLYVTVTHVLDGRLADGIEDDYCVLSIVVGAVTS